MYSILSIVLTAHAFAPSTETWIGSEPVRLYHTDTRRQLELARQPAWVEFTQGIGAGWTARFDQRTGTPRRMWGPGIDVGPVASAPEAERAVRAVLADAPGLAGVLPGELRFRRASHDTVGDTWFVHFDRLVGSVPIWRGGATARIKAGRLVLLRLDTYPEARVAQAELSAAEAELEAQLQGPAGLAEHTEVSSELMALPEDTPGGVALRLVWVVRSRTTEPLGHWVSFVDAGSGALVHSYNEIRFLSGTVSGTHPARTLDGEYATTGLPLVEVVGSSTAYADLTGAYVIDGDSAATTLTGSYLEVRNASGDEGTLSFSDPNPVWDEQSASLAEIASYAFVHQVKAWGMETAPEIRMSSVALRSTVNDSRGNCNAYYDGNLNFYSAGGGCNNTGQIADVNYHEWGHGFHYYAVALGGGSSMDGSVGEGVGDTVAFLLTADSTIAPYFQTNGGGIREVGRNRSYPDDVTGEVHTDGLIFAGAVWDLWEELAATYGESREDRGQAWTITSVLLANALKGSPALDTAYEEFVLADDDDGDLSNGTPHLCEIAAAFAEHGLGPLADGNTTPIVVDHLSLTNQVDGSAITVEATTMNPLESCTPFTLSAGTLWYSLDGGESWLSAPAAVDGLQLSATFPEIPAGSIVSYYLEATGSNGETATAPTIGEIAPYTFYVGELTELWCSGLTEDEGFTHELISGDDREGANDWQHGTPQGIGGDPEEAFTGRRVWGNDLGADGYNGEYQADIHNRLTTPAFAVDANEVIVQYRRWLGVEDGFYDQARVLANDQVIWSNHTTNEQIGDENTIDDEWMLSTHRATVSGGSLTLAWEIQSDGGFESHGWNLDDLCLYAPVLPAEDSGTDVAGEPVDEDEGIDLSSGGCGCASSSASGGLWVLATLWLATRRRR